jgi:hypothetical protein
MSVITPLPDAAYVKELLGLVFDSLTVKPGAKLDISPKGVSYFGLDAANDAKLSAVCACDLAFAAQSGAALSMLPPISAKEAMKQRELSPVMLENLYEVMNICTRLVLRDDSPPVKLRTVTQMSALPAEQAASIGAAKRRADFEIGSEKYGSGLLAVLCSLKRAC